MSGVCVMPKHVSRDGQVIDLFDRTRYCKGQKGQERCHRVDCESHCWGCGQAHDSSDLEFPYCTTCDLEMNTNQDVDLTGFWDPPTEVLATERRKQVFLNKSLDEILREVGQEWLRKQDLLDES